MFCSVNMPPPVRLMRGARAHVRHKKKSNMSSAQDLVQGRPSFRESDSYTVGTDYKWPDDMLEYVFKISGVNIDWTTPKKELVLITSRRAVYKSGQSDVKLETLTIFIYPHELDTLEHLGGSSHTSVDEGTLKIVLAKRRIDEDGDHDYRDVALLNYIVRYPDNLPSEYKLVFYKRAQEQLISELDEQLKTTLAKLRGTEPSDSQESRKRARN